MLGTASLPNGLVETAKATDGTAKPALLLPLLVEFQRRCALLCDLGVRKSVISPIFRFKTTCGNGCRVFQQPVKA
jgi:hypothetical protein